MACPFDNFQMYQLRILLWSTINLGRTLGRNCVTVRRNRSVYNHFNKWSVTKDSIFHRNWGFELIIILNIEAKINTYSFIEITCSIWEKFCIYSSSSVLKKTHRQIICVLPQRGSHTKQLSSVLSYCATYYAAPRSRQWRN